MKEIEKELKTTIRNVDRELIRNCDENIFGSFLQSVVDEFRQEPKLKTRVNDVDITDHDRLMFLRDVENGWMCWKFYKMSKRRGLDLELEVVLVKKMN